MQSIQQSTSHARMLRPKDAADYLGVSTSYLQKLRGNGKGPTFVKISPKLVTYDRAALDAWLAAHQRTSTSDSGTAT